MKVNIIGGGIIGMSTAYHLALKGVDVTIFEKDKMFDVASFGRACGGVRYQFFTRENILLSQHSIDFIKNKTSIDFTPNGYLMLFGEDQQEDYKHSTQLQQELGATTKTLTPDQLKELHPWISVDDIYRACYTDDGSEGWIDASLHTWFKDEAIKLGAKINWIDGRWLIPAGHRILALQQESPNKEILEEAYDCDATVIASGCWTGEVARLWDIEIPVKGHKHTVYNISTEAEQVSTMPLVADLITGVYWRPEGEGYIVGYDGNSEWDSKDLEPNWNKWEETWEKLYHRCPTLFDAIKADGGWAGYYDTNIIDNNAIIDHVGNVYFATGFTGRGLMQSPAVGLILSDMILGETPKFNLDNYKLNREPFVEKYVI